MVRITLALAVTTGLAMATAGCSKAPIANPEVTASASATGPEANPTSPEAVPSPAAVQEAASGHQDIPATFHALGTEPFWSASVDGTKLVWSTPEQPNGLTVPVTRRDEGGVATYNGVIADQPLTLEVRRETCSDGMSDRVYPLSVKRRLGADSQQGCAR